MNKYVHAAGLVAGGAVLTTSIGISLVYFEQKEKMQRLKAAGLLEDALRATPLAVDGITNSERQQFFTDFMQENALQYNGPVPNPVRAENFLHKGRSVPAGRLVEMAKNYRFLPQD